MRKGYTIIETLVGAIVMFAIVIAIGPLIMMLIKDIPQHMAMHDSHDQLVHLIDKMAEDASVARAVRERYAGWEAGPQCLILESDGGVTVWRQDQDRFIREVYDDPNITGTTPAEADEWTIRNGHLDLAIKHLIRDRDEWGEWDVIEVESWIEYKQGAHRHQKWHNGSDLFIGGSLRSREYQWQDYGSMGMGMMMPGMGAPMETAMMGMTKDANAMAGAPAAVGPELNRLSEPNRLDMVHDPNSMAPVINPNDPNSQEAL